MNARVPCRYGARLMLSAVSALPVRVLKHA
jgi:hypothetical protein